MKLTIIALLSFLFTLLPSITLSQTLEELKQQYQPLSPLTFEKMQPSQMVSPEAGELTPELEKLDQLKAQEQAEAQARDERIFLDTDYKFFQALAVPLQDDELDKVYKKNLVEKDILQAQLVDSTVKSEIKTTAPKPMTAIEAAAVDSRRQMMRKHIADNARTIKSCIIEVGKKGGIFTGSEMTLAWDVSQQGKVEDAKIQSTDVANEDVKRCVIASMAGWNFTQAMKSANKKARIQYTFRFTKEVKSEVALKSSERTPAQN